MQALTEKQTAALKSLVGGPGPMAIKHFGTLKDMGLVKRAENVSASRGYVGAELTPNGVARANAND